MDDIKQLIAACAAMHLQRVAQWHEEPDICGLPVLLKEMDKANFKDVAEAEHRANYDLWHVEDEARRQDVDDSHIAACKRAIDGLNQKRNDLMERLDQQLIKMVETRLPEGTPRRFNTESLGSCIDRLSILGLKIYHMEAETLRSEAGPEHVEECRAKLDRLQRQREDLLASVLEVVDEYAAGRKRPYVYRQFKMYNDPRLNPSLYGKGGSE